MEHDVPEDARKATAPAAGETAQSWSQSWTPGVKGSFIFGIVGVACGVGLLSMRPSERARGIDDSMVGLHDLMTDVGWFSVVAGAALSIVALGIATVRDNRIRPSDGA